MKPITSRFDFFSTSNCRDLMFHVQEHRLSLPAIKAFLAENDLQFLGFLISSRHQRRYAARFPDDPAMIDLDRWHMFETENPKTFLSHVSLLGAKARVPTGLNQGSIRGDIREYRRDLPGHIPPSQSRRPRPSFA